MEQDTIHLYITIDADDADAEERDNLAHQLLHDFDELDDISAELAKGDNLPEGTMGVGMEIGTLLIQAGVAAAAIKGMFDILQSWLSRSERRKLTLQIGDNKVEVTGMSMAQQRKLLEWFQSETGFQLEA